MNNNAYNNNDNVYSDYNMSDGANASPKYLDNFDTDKIKEYSGYVSPSDDKVVSKMAKRNSMPRKKFGKAAGLTIRTSDSEEEEVVVKPKQILNQKQPVEVMEYGHSQIMNELLNSDDGRRSNNDNLNELKEIEDAGGDLQEIVQNDFRMCEFEDVQSQGMAENAFGYGSGKQEFYATLNRGQFSRPETPQYFDGEGAFQQFQHQRPEQYGQGFQERSPVNDNNASLLVKAQEEFEESRSQEREVILDEHFDFNQEDQIHEQTHQGKEDVFDFMEEAQVEAHELQDPDDEDIPEPQIMMKRGAATAIGTNFFFDADENDSEEEEGSVHNQSALHEQFEEQSSKSEQDVKDIGTTAGAAALIIQDQDQTEQIYDQAPLLCEEDTTQIKQEPIHQEEIQIDEEAILCQELEEINEKREQQEADQRQEVEEDVDQTIIVVSIQDENDREGPYIEQQSFTIEGALEPVTQAIEEVKYDQREVEEEYTPFARQSFQEESDEDQDMSNRLEDFSQSQQSEKEDLAQQEAAFNIEEYNYDKIGKWEEQNKEENEINEIESLEFSVKREELHQDSGINQQNYASLPFGQTNQSSIMPNSSNISASGESMMIFQSPNKLMKSNVKQTRSTSKLPLSSKGVVFKLSASQLDLKKPQPPPIVEKVKKYTTGALKLQESKSIQKMKELFSSEEKFRQYEKLHSKDTASSLRKRRGYPESADLGGLQDHSFLKSKPDLGSQVNETVGSHKTIINDPCHQLYERGVQIKVQKMQLREAQKQVQDQANLQECTFRPNTQLSLKGQRMTSVHNERELKMYQRTKIWEEQRLSKIKQEQEKTKVDSIRDCSFNPALRNLSVSSVNSTRAQFNGIRPSKQNQNSTSQINIQINESASRNSLRQSTERSMTKDTSVTSLNKRMARKDSTSSVIQERGVQKFLERQQKAKEQKTQVHVALEKHDGSKWRHEVTKPNPPKITDIIIQNLQSKLNQNNQKIIAAGKERTSSKASEGRSSYRPSFNKDQKSSRESSLTGRASLTNQDSSKKLATVSKPGVVTKGKPLEFKDAVKFLRGALHNLNLDK